MLRLIYDLFYILYLINVKIKQMIEKIVNLFNTIACLFTYSAVANKR